MQLFVFHPYEGYPVTSLNRKFKDLSPLSHAVFCKKISKKYKMLHSEKRKVNLVFSNLCDDRSRRGMLMLFS
jgi:hypothetical protein